jgi:hypothetical protein
LAALPGPRFLCESFDCGFAIVVELEGPVFKAFPFEEGCCVVSIDNGWVVDSTEGPAFGFSTPSFEEALSRRIFFLGGDSELVTSSIAQSRSSDLFLLPGSSFSLLDSKEKLFYFEAQIFKNIYI